MPGRPPSRLFLPALLLIVGAAHGADDDGASFFERKIRPVLVRECYDCHAAGARKVRGGLLLDSRAGVLAGGDSGPAMVPGKPEESLLLAALRHEGPEMPPRGKLPGRVIDDFARWITMGAPDPRVSAPAPPRPASTIDLEAGRRSWAYQPPLRHEAPTVADAAWPASGIDRFVLARLEARGLRPAGDTDRATLARRLWYDLIGLPPSPEELDDFVNDPTPDAYERRVDHLLASPRFGERWGRHWLDVVRFAESLTLRGFLFKEAWRYRDYVIDSFNADRPFDRFVAEQVAGDLLTADSPDLDERRRGRIATTFLVLGNINLEEQDKEQLRMDVVDEQLDTIGKVFLAQTIGCARCHDHKFDPIPTRDYYAMAGILRNVKTLEHANVSKWIELPLPLDPIREGKVREHERAVAALRDRIKAARKTRGTGLKRGVLAVASLPGIVVDDAQARPVGTWVHSRYSGSYIGSGYVHDGDDRKGEKTLTFQPDLPRGGEYEVRLAYSPGSSRARAVPVTVLAADGETTLAVDLRAEPPIDGRFLALGRFRFESGNQGYVLISNEGTNGHVTADAVQFLPVGGKQGRWKASPDDGQLRRMEAELKRLEAAGPHRDRSMAVVEQPERVDIRIHIRGSVHTLGDPVPRGFLRVATIGRAPAFSGSESGRRELAGWLASRDNPLTARAIVNRAWHWLLGAGLVRTTDNFGRTGEVPSHPELLDTMAVRFMERGWSIKGLVRDIVLSRTYRLASVGDPSGRASAVDPEDRLLWRANRRRLDAECLRDTMLAVAGRLDDRMGGPSFPMSLAADYGYARDDGRRSVYQPVFRNALPELFEAFDFADPSMVVGRRNASTTAPQALYLLNHPFAIAQAQAAAARILAIPVADDTRRVERAFRLVLGRPPSPSEARAALDYLHGVGDRAEEAWASMIQSLFASIDFRYVY